MAIRSVVFDVGETLMDDSTFWGSWADWLGVPRHTLAALVGAVTALGHDNVEALRLICPDFDLAAERQAREEAGQGETISESDLYPDVRPALSALKANGLWVGIAGNQTTRAAELLAALDLPVDAIATSGQWGVAKPSTEFYDYLIAWAPGAPDEIVYVGDHPVNDILPAKAAGLHTAHIRRGPWGYLHADDQEVKENATWRINSLTELASLLTTPAG
ncbi:HAD family hydrolase [Actinocorallia populi]|uniref:HAD family hydrolase n=1 Tax=Actinocorallia populi TaxID=2079200 RepID=UPI000D097DE4|nr:HAD family hydrolase [Actinocorallia populi]